VIDPNVPPVNMKKAEVADYLKQFMTDQRYGQFVKVLENRTRYVTVVLEDIYQSQNASAVLRTCECFGIQDVHVIENLNEYKVNPDVALGSEKWLSLYKYNSASDNTTTALETLRKKGYSLVATIPDEKSCSIGEIDITQGKVALLFGTELKVLSDKAVEMADKSIRIPMSGFTQSFNISVAAGIIIYQITRLLQISEVDWHLSQAEKTDILLSWIRNSIRKSIMIEKRWLNCQNSGTI
jgi:tRNA (guanosine-2'-O-)-methyltransferase